MKKSIKCAVLSVLMVCCLVFSLPLTAYAAPRLYSFNFSEPPTGDGQGYVLVEYQNISTGKYYVQCFLWNSFLIGSSNIGAIDDTSMFISVNGTTISFEPIFQSQYTYGACFSYFFDYEGALNRYYYREVSSPMQTIYSFDLGSAYRIISVKASGDFISLETDFTNRDNFTVSWGETALVLDELSLLISQLQILVQNDPVKLQLLRDILTYTNDIETLLTSIDSRLYVNNSQNDTIVSRLTEILNTLRGSGESTFEEPDTSSLDDYNKAEDELVSGAEDTSDIEQQIEDFEIDANASASIWDIITKFISVHPKVMGLVIGILCLGIIALILNR